MNFQLYALGLAAAIAYAQEDPSWMTKGVDAYRHARYSEAIQCFEHAVTDDPQSADARLSLALGYLAAYVPGEESRENRLLWKNAEENLRAALEIDPRNLDAVLYLAQFYFDEAYAAPAAKKDEKLNQAQQLYQKAAGINPKSKQAYYALGAIEWHKSSHRLDEAARQFNHALELDSNYADAMQYLAAIQREKGDTPAADALLARARKVRQAKEHGPLPLEWPPPPVVFLPLPPAQR